MSAPMTERGYWVLFHEWECVICTKTDVYRERIFDRPKPKAWHERHIVHETACPEHFL